MASEGGASFNKGVPGDTFTGRGRSMSCTFHFWPGIWGVSLYPRTSSPADAGGCCAPSVESAAMRIRSFMFLIFSNSIGRMTRGPVHLNLLGLVDRKLASGDRCVGRPGHK